MLVRKTEDMFMLWIDHAKALLCIVVETEQNSELPKHNTEREQD